MNVTIVYDGMCPVCRHLVRAARLRERTARLELVDARRDPVNDIQGSDLSELDFDEGFAVVVNGQVHHGAQGARMLALLTEPTGIGYRLFRCLMTGERRSRLWYPALRAGRSLLLRLLWIPKIGRKRQP